MRSARAFSSVRLLIVAERQSTFIFHCRVGRRPTGAALAIECSTATIALDIHLENGGMMNEAIDGNERVAGSGNTLPFAKRLIGGDQH
jgi:hypothetical protein